jgi:transposase-like protein
VNQRTSKSSQRRRHLTAKEKRKILTAHERSGLSMLGFARRHRLCYTSLRRWRSSLNSKTPLSTSAAPNPDPHFVPVTLEGEPLESSYVLTWPGGRTLKIPWQFELESLRRLLSVLEVRP